MHVSIGPVTKRLWLATAVVALALAAAPIAVAATAVDISGNAFAPQSITIHVGDSVTWANSDARSHTATADDGSFNTGTIHNGETTAAVRFDAVGTVTYHCSIHPEMHGTIVVAAAALPPTDTNADAGQSRSGAPSVGGVLGVIGVLAGALFLGWRRFGREGVVARG